MNAAGEPISYCGVEFDSPPGSGYSSYDRSLFRWNAYKFVEDVDGAYTMFMVPTNLQLQAPTNSPGLSQGDSNGDGTTDVYFRLHNAGGITYYPTDLPAADQGPYISRNLMRAPDLLITATNGLGAVSNWTHRPLSDRKAETDPRVGCNMPEPFYVAHLDDDKRSDGYAFFTSSMWAVARFDISNGVGAGTNKTCYRYQDAMVNMEGRGFQGFKKIVAEEQMPPAAGEPPGFSGCGGTCSLNNRRTTSEFFQEFPLTSRLSKVTVAQVTSTAFQTLSETTYWWDVKAHGTAAGAYVVSGTGTLEKSYETSGALASQKTTIREIDQLSGEPSHQCALSLGQASDVNRDVLVHDKRSFPNVQADISGWWLGKLDSRVVVSDFGGGLTLGTCQLSGSSLPSWSCSGTTPVCPTVTASSDAKTQTTNYSWNADNGDNPGNSGSSRQLDHLDLVAQGVTEATTAFWYDQFGNTRQKQVTARDVAGGASYPPGNTGPVLLPASTYTFSPDGYFVATETNPMGHLATITTDARTGLRSSYQAVQGGPVAGMIYDELGRLKTTLPSATSLTFDSLKGLVSAVANGIQPIERRIVVCGVGDCVIKEQQFQAGAPIKTGYLDMLGRTIAMGVEGFDSKEILTKVDYNARGVRIAEHEPITTGASPGAWNGTLASSFMTQYSGIDVVGRTKTKTVVRSSTPDLFETGRGTANLVTTYSYSVGSLGIQTSITVSTPTAASGQITMSRTYDPRGRLVQTVQTVTAPTTHDIITSYSYDPAGNVTVVTDSGDNKLKAVYDNLGRKIEVDDPDRGKWFYNWDGLGRVRTQKDARGITLAYQYDAIGRMERRFRQQQTGAPWLLEALWQYDSSGKLGTLGSVFGLTDNTAGTSLDPSQSDSLFHRDYKYDGLLRPWSAATHIPAETIAGVGAWASQDLTIEYGYDHNYGRVKAMSSPGPNKEFVRFDYDTHGFSIGETPLGSDGNSLAGAAGSQPAYRQVTLMSVRNQVKHQFFGNNVDESMEYDDSTGLAISMTASGLHEPSTSCPNASTPLVRQVIYTYDHFLNLARQEKDLYSRDANGALSLPSCSPVMGAATEIYQYDELQRLTGTSRSWVNITPDAAATLPTQYSYNDLGNITGKSDYASVYTYSMPPPNSFTAPGPHAVTSLSNGMTFAYDANGNMTSSTGVDARTVTFDNLDRPIKIVKGSATTVFRYAPDGSRYLQGTATGANPYPKTVYYVDKMYEKIVWNGATEEKTYIGPSTVVYRGTNRDVRYLHVDRLGSVEAVTTSTAAEYVLDRHGFDAFGQPRNADFTTGIGRLHSNDYNVTTERGFTGHEHLDETFLIHMNGRVYDYKLARFLSVDTVISSPTNSQSINPYSYIGNNPLSGVDPTGYECNDYSFSRCDTIHYNSEERQRNPLKSTIEKFLKQWNGSSSTDKNAATSETNSPNQTAKKNEPTSRDVEVWLKENYPSLLNDFRQAWKQYTAAVGEKWSRAPSGVEVGSSASTNAGSTTIAFLGYVHRKIIDGAFPYMSESDRGTLKSASDYTDKIGGTSTDPYFEQMHAMRSPGQTVQQAREAHQAWIAEQLNIAIVRERYGDHEGAMFSLGMGMHAIMDSHSAAHEGFKEWAGTLRTGLYHLPWDFLTGHNPFRLGAAAIEIQTYYNSFILRSRRPNDDGW